MMQGIIAQAQKSKSGKTLRIRVGEQWYSTNNFALESAVGRNVQFEVGTSEYQGNVIYWANDAELVTDVGAPQPPQGVAPPPSAAAPSNVAATVEPMALMPFTSNTVAHAIQAGLITKPEEIHAWASKAFNTAKSLVTGKAPEPNPDFDDDIPF